jgi:toxin ParE1/3/4
MIPVEWSNRARRDLADHVKWLMRQDRAAARQMAVDVLEAANSLARYPGKGRKGRFEGVRELSVPKWCKVVFVEEDVTKITIVAIIDTRMKPPDKF